MVREMRQEEYPLLEEFLYEAIFVPEGMEAPARDIILRPELQVYIKDFGSGASDICYVDEEDGRVVGAVWVRDMEDYGHVAENVPSFAISLYKEYRNRGIGTVLMKTMLSRLAGDGYKRASLAVQKENYAVRMYRKVGFKVIDENEEEYIMDVNFAGGCVIREAHDPDEKRAAARSVLEQLKAWFEVDENREKYIKESGDQIFVGAFKGDEAVGFLTLNETGAETVELAVMGVKPEFHRYGIGRELVLKAKEIASGQGYSFMQVKTVAMGMYEDYDRTNLFYKGVGFKEFEVMPLLWDEANPCQIYVMYLGEHK